MKRNTMIAAFVLMTAAATAQTEPVTTPVPQSKDTVPVKASDSIPAVKAEAAPVVTASPAQSATPATSATSTVVVTPIKSPEQAQADHDAAVAAAASRVTYSSGLEPTWNPLEKGKVTMFDGQAYITDNNKAKPISADITLTDGTIISANGTIQKANGKKWKLKNGQEYKYGQAKATSKS